jgi:DNA-3-methyladenine glycosylase II
MDERAHADWHGTTIFTIGHSTRPIEEFLGLLRAAHVDALADVRTIPRSRRHPQFNSDALADALAAAGIRYRHVAKLGGLRHARPDSANTGWRNASFRGYADYMQTDAFEAGLDELRDLAASGTTAIMCAEAVPWRCHRSLVADVLIARGAAVLDIVGAGRPATHRMTPFARVDGARVTYPGEPGAAAEKPRPRRTGTRLAVEPPFHFEAAVRVLQRRPTNRVDVWRDGRYRRVHVTRDGLVLVEVRNDGTIDAPDVRLGVLAGSPSPATKRALAATTRKMLALEVDPEPLTAAALGVPALRATARALRGFRPPRFASLFDTFVGVVPFQQLSLDAGTAILGRLVERLAQSIEHEGERYFAMPTAAEVAAAPLPALLECGLSRTKADALQRLATLVEAGTLDERGLAKLDTPDALEALRGLPGIGPWSAALVLLRGFGRVDVFPPGDSGAARSLGALLELGDPAELDALVESFGAYRGFLYLCGLGAALVAKGLIGAAPPAPRSARVSPSRAD